MKPKDHVGSEVAFFAEMRARVGRNLHHLSGSRLKQAHIQEGLELTPGRVVAVDQRLYTPPRFLPKVVGAEETATLAAVLQEVKSANDAVVGEPLRHMTVLLNGDERILELRDELRCWGDRYTRKRLARPHPKDRGDPVATWNRLNEELVPWLEELTFESGDTIHSLYLKDFCDYIAWLFFQGTWRKKLTFRRTGDRVQVDWGTIPPTRWVYGV